MYIRSQNYPTQTAIPAEKIEAIQDYACGTQEIEHMLIAIMDSGRRYILASGDAETISRVYENVISKLNSCKG